MQHHTPLYKGADIFSALFHFLVFQETKKFPLFTIFQHPHFQSSESIIVFVSVQFDLQDFSELWHVSDNYCRLYLGS